MTEQQKETIAQFCIEPAQNRLAPENSDGYNESEMYVAIRKAIDAVVSSYTQITKKADKWDQYEKEIEQISAAHKLMMQQGIINDNGEQTEYQKALVADAKSWRELQEKLLDSNLTLHDKGKSIELIMNRK